LLLGTSRKAFIGKITGKEQALERDVGTAATLAIGVYNGARIVRTHNVEITRQAVAIADAVRRETTEQS
jgi:dihydropteroate synthase